MSIKCAHCGGSHPTVAEVKVCSTENPLAAEYEAPNYNVIPEESLYEIPAVPQPILGVHDKLREGIYSSGEHFYKIIMGKKGFPYAMILEEDQSWKYAPGAVKELRHEDRLDIEGLKNYGKETGRCILCGRELTNPVSIEQGIGPICAGKYR